MEGGLMQTSAATKVPPQKIEGGNSFAIRLKKFLEKNTLNLEIPERRERVDVVKKSTDKTILGNYVIANNFRLATETNKVTLAYRDGSDQLLVVKETTQKEMEGLANSHSWGNTTPEEYLKKTGFKDQNVLLPVATIKKDGKVYRFYEAMDMDLEKYLETHNQLSIKEGISLIIRACSGIQALHEVGVANVDLAPLNTMLTSKSLKLIDLDATSIDKNDDGILTRNYNRSNRFTSSPELFEEKPIFDKTVDVYAAAANLYRLIAGDWPYNIEEGAKNLTTTEKRDAYKKLHEEGNVNFPDSIPPAIRRVIKKGMSPIPKDRYQSISEFMSELMDAAERQADMEQPAEEKGGDKLYVINNQKLESFLARLPTNGQKVEVLNELVGMYLNNEILQKLNLNTTIEEIRGQLEECVDIKDPQEFIKRIHAILKPIDTAREEHPEAFAKIERKTFMESHPSFIPLNEILSYRIDGGDLHLHLAPAADFNTGQKIDLIKDALEKLLKIISSNKKVREVSATSWVVANNPRFFTRIGFKIQGPISDETRKVDFESETRPISRASMSRSEFLAKYSKKKSLISLIRSWLGV